MRLTRPVMAARRRRVPERARVSHKSGAAGAPRKGGEGAAGYKIAQFTR